MRSTHRNGCWLLLLRARRSDTTADLEIPILPPRSADLVVSGLVLHCVANYSGLIRRIVGWLRPGGPAGVLAGTNPHQADPPY